MPSFQLVGVCFRDRLENKEFIVEHIEERQLGMAEKRNHSDSPEKGHKKNPLYREYRLLPRKRDESGKVTKPVASLSKEKKRTRPPGEAPQAETGGPGGHEPTRYGDWERKGRCVDF